MVFDLIAVHYHAPETFQQTLHDVQAWAGRPASITVVDNSAGEGTAERLRSGVGPAVTVLECAGNPGYGAAMNLALQDKLNSDPPYVLLVTQDVVITEQAVAALIEYLESDERAAIAAPLLTYASDPTRVFSAGGLLDSKAQTSHAGSGTDPRVWADLPPYEIAWADGAVLLVRKEALRRVGCFDERFFLYFEEIELQLRMRLAGWSIRMVPAAVCSQEPGNFRPYLRLRNRALLQRAFPALFDQRPRVLICDAIRVSLLGLKERRWGTLLEVAHALRDVGLGHYGKPS